MLEPVKQLTTLTPSRWAARAVCLTSSIARALTPAGSPSPHTRGGTIAATSYLGGSAIYTQNKDGTRLINDIIAFRLFTTAINIYTEGGFSDGGKAVGVPLRVLDAAGKVLIEGAMSAHSDFTFPKPKVDFRVVFDGGEGHIVTIDGRDIAK